MSAMVCNNYDSIQTQFQFHWHIAVELKGLLLLAWEKKDYGMKIA